MCQSQLCLVQCRNNYELSAVSNFTHKKVQRYSSIIVSHFKYNLKLLRNCYLSVSMQVYWTVMCNSMVIRYSTGYSYYAHNNVTAYWKNNKETTLLIRWIWYTEGFLTFVSWDWRKPYSCSLSGSNSRFVLHRIVVVSNLSSYKQAWNKVFQLQQSAITPQYHIDRISKKHLNVNANLLVGFTTTKWPHFIVNV